MSRHGCGFVWHGLLCFGFVYQVQLLTMAETGKKVWLFAWWCRKKLKSSYLVQTLWLLMKKWMNISAQVRYLTVQNNGFILLLSTDALRRLATVYFHWGLILRYRVWKALIGIWHIDLFPQWIILLAMKCLSLGLNETFSWFHDLQHL